MRRAETGFFERDDQQYASSKITTSRVEIMHTRVYRTSTKVTVLHDIPSNIVME